MPQIPGLLRPDRLTAASALDLTAGDIASPAVPQLLMLPAVAPFGGAGGAHATSPSTPRWGGPAIGEVAPPAAGFRGRDAHELGCGNPHRVTSAAELDSAERATVDHAINGREVDAERAGDLPRREEHRQRVLMRLHLRHKEIL